MRFVIASLLLVTLISCKKDSIQYTIKGNILDNIDATYLEGVEVQVFQKPFNNSITSNAYELVGTATTDNAGFYSITFDREKATEFKVTLEKDGYFTEEIELNSDYFTSKTDNILNYSMDGESWINMHIVNLPPAQTSDNLSLSWYVWRTGCAGCIETEYHIFSGIIDTTFVHRNTAGDHLKFIYNDGTSATIDSVLMPHNDTVFYTIDF